MVAIHILRSTKATGAPSVLLYVFSGWMRHGAGDRHDRFR